ncbi:hypothetical protein HDV06_006973 [Boothiomyces sp. JEL0866]|nr:hypothetical protein HDV06_006973 [Boothiomyces sp. JEL0866]
MLFLKLVISIVLAKKKLDFEAELRSKWYSEFQKQVDQTQTYPEAFSAIFYKLEGNHEKFVDFNNGTCYTLEGEPKGGPTEGTLWRVGSVSKMYASATAFQLIEQGVLERTAPVADYLPWLQDSVKEQNILVQDLLQHTTSFDEIGLWNKQPVEFPHPPSPHKDSFQRLTTDYIGHVGVMGGPSYSNQGWVLLGAVVEEISGMLLGDYLKQNIFKSLDIKSSGFSYQQKDLNELCFSTGAKANRELYDIDGYATGDMVSNPKDVLKFFTAFLKNGKGIFNSSLTMDLMKKPMYYHDWFGENGFINGFEFQQHGSIKIWTKGGAVEGFSSFAFIIPEFNEAGVFFSSPLIHHYSRALNAYLNILHPKELNSSPGVYKFAQLTFENIAATQKVKGHFRNKRTIWHGVVKYFLMPYPTFSIRPISNSNRISVTLNTLETTLQLVEKTNASDPIPANILLYQDANRTLSISVVFHKKRISKVVVSGTSQGTQSTYYHKSILDSLLLVQAGLYINLAVHILTFVLAFFAIKRLVHSKNNVDESAPLINRETRGNLNQKIIDILAVITPIFSVFFFAILVKLLNSNVSIEDKPKIIVGQLFLVLFIVHVGLVVLATGIGCAMKAKLANRWLVFAIAALQLFGLVQVVNLNAIQFRVW